jgi:hypothetical protein
MLPPPARFSDGAHREPNRNRGEPSCKRIANGRPRRWPLPAVSLHISVISSVSVKPSKRHRPARTWMGEGVKAGPSGAAAEPQRNRREITEEPNSGARRSLAGAVARRQGSGPGGSGHRARDGPGAPAGGARERSGMPAVRAVRGGAVSAAARAAARRGGEPQAGGRPPDRVARGARRGAPARAAASGGAPQRRIAETDRREGNGPWYRRRWHVGSEGRWRRSC